MAQEMVSWCDKLASTPAAGFQLTPQYAPASLLMEAFSPELNKLYDDDTPQFTVEHTDNFNFTYTTNVGFQTAIEPAKVSVAFVHRLKATATSGGPPALQMLSQPQPYTLMLPLVFGKVITTALLLPDVSKRSLRRVGVITTTTVDEDLAPPGIRKLLAHFVKPWGNLHNPYNFHFVADLNEDHEVAERCVHTLARAEPSDSLLTLIFDWQRSFKKPRLVTEDHLKEVAHSAERSALSYFEELAEGTRLV